MFLNGFLIRHISVSWPVLDCLFIFVHFFYRERKKNE